MKLTLFFILIVFESSIANLPDKANRYTKILCEKTDPENIVVSLYCSIKNYSRTLSTLSIGLVLRKPMDNIFMDYKMSYKFLNNYRQIIYLKDVNLCSFLNNAESNMFLRYPLLLMKAEFPNIKFTCPWSEIHLDNITIDAGNVNLTYPAGTYRTEFWFKNKGVIKVSTFFVSNSKDKTEI